MQKNIKSFQNQHQTFHETKNEMDSLGWVFPVGLGGGGGVGVAGNYEVNSKYTKLKLE